MLVQGICNTSLCTSRRVINHKDNELVYYYLDMRGATVGGVQSITKVGQDTIIVKVRVKTEGLKNELNSPS